MAARVLASQGRSLPFWPFLTCCYIPSYILFSVGHVDDRREATFRAVSSGDDVLLAAGRRCGGNVAAWRCGGGLPAAGWRAAEILLSICAIAKRDENVTPVMTSQRIKRIQLDLDKSFI